MTLTKLYTEGTRVIRSNEHFDKGVAEVGGVEAVAPLWFVQEQRAKMEYGETAWGRVREGIIGIPANYVLCNPKPIRAIALRGLPLINPKKAEEANKGGRYYSPNPEKYAHAILSALKNSIPIDEKDIEGNILKMGLEDFVSEYTIALFGGEGSQQEKEDRVKAASRYFRESLDKLGKEWVKAIRLLLPNVDEDIIGTQIFACGFDIEFNLSGGSPRGLYDGNGVFGVCN